MPTVLGTATLVGGSSITAAATVTHDYIAPLPTGGITLGGSAIYSPSASIEILQDFTWNIFGELKITKSFSWQTGKAPLYWYRVVGKSIVPTKYMGRLIPLSNQPRILYTEILARSVASVCQQLHDRQLNWPILTMHRHYRPAETAKVKADEAKGIDYSYDAFIPVDFASCPACLDFTITANAVATGGLSATGSVVTVYRYVGSGGIKLGGGAMPPQRRYTSSGGITLGGSAVVQSSAYRYTSSGGITLGGSANVLSSYHRYTSSGGITLGGHANVTAPSFTYRGSGGITLSGSAKQKISKRFRASGGITLGGTATIAIQNPTFIAPLPTGGITLGGSAHAAPSYHRYVGSGGVTLGGSAVVQSSNWNYTASGGIVLGGGCRYRYPVVAVGSGGITLGGSAGVRVNYRYIPSGGIVLGGSAGVVSPAYRYIGSGGIVLGGTAPARANNLGTLVATGGLSSSLYSISADFSGEDAAPALVPQEVLVGVGCSCPPLPTTLQITHNLGQTGILSDFIAQNGLTLPSEVRAFYSRVSKSWRANMHLKGVGNNGLAETWTILMEWQCTSNIGSFNLGSSVWKFSLQVTKKNVSTIQYFDTRVLVSFSPENVCNTRPFRFGFTLDTKRQLVTAETGVTVGTEILYDETGLFRSAGWLKSPILVINLAEIGVVSSDQRLDMSNMTPIATALA
jgi:hypothetical protein